MILIENDLSFSFTDALNVVKFDDRNHGLSHCMKAVDFIIELEEYYLFVEVKDPSHPRSRPENTNDFTLKVSDGSLQRELLSKYRDTFIYRWSQDKLDKPVHYLSLITLDDAQLQNLETSLKLNLPLQKISRWSKPIALSCNVLNLNAWNRNFPKWPVTRISDSAGE